MDGSTDNANTTRVRLLRSHVPVHIIDRVIAVDTTAPTQTTFETSVGNQTTVAFLSFSTQIAINPFKVKRKTNN